GETFKNKCIKKDSDEAHLCANILYTGRITFFGSYGAKTFSAVDAKDGVTIVILKLPRERASKAFKNK
ncbi:MAG: hypothetical protein J3Q66DRAFT_389355, partial [Benniella sp.]